MSKAILNAEAQGPGPHTHTYTHPRDDKQLNKPKPLPIHTRAREPTPPELLPPVQPPAHHDGAILNGVPVVARVMEYSIRIPSELHFGAPS
ncbi:hypothetical protein CMEL01_01346 [Colletotrichum melonis]|uniref:Uncharacterized protein n=1 Tax=Colletotrichum melonis TaxID=1209925 RepID=A0AAI9V6D1_9PEZI|nr:hypothetical protein CMEL01_01346 [Colletotrichum melonis]